MCGIIGIHSSAHRVDMLKLSSAVRSLHHRGPDGQGCWVASGGRAGLGHTRLSVIDVDNGAQPIANEDGSIVAVVNGEFYGFEELRCELEARGHRFKTKSDSEILIHLYEDGGTKCLDKLRGEFAFILWDDRQQLLFAARDRFGIKPLFYSASRETLTLASEAKALFAAGVDAKWSHDSVFRALFLSLGQEQSLFEGVKQVPPGHFLISKSTGVRVQSYWDAEYPFAGNGAQYVENPEQCIEEVRHLIDEAVRLRMRADVPVGCLLSGGLDSSAVLGFASRHSSQPIRAFTIAFDDADFDESALARQTALDVGAEFEPVDASSRMLAENFAESVGHGEIIQYNAHGTARFLLSKAVKKSGYKVVMGGEGADELFAGYGFVSSAIMSRASHGSVRGKIELLARILRPATQDERVIRNISPWLVRMSRVLNLSNGVTGPLAGRLQMMESLLDQSFMTARRETDPYREMFEALSPMSSIRGREPAKQLIYLWMKSIFPSYVLAADRADMAHGVEVRLPFLDHVLFEYMRHVPVSLLALNGRRKHVLREAASPFIPEAARDRVKKPLMAPPLTRGGTNALNEAVQDILRGDAMKHVPFLNNAAILRLADRGKLTGSAAADPLMLMAASLSVLQERYSLA